MYATTVDIRGVFLNAQFTSDNKPIYLHINKNIVPYRILGSSLRHRTRNKEQGKRQLILLLDRFLYELKQSPLKF